MLFFHLNSLGLVQGTDYDVINTADSTNEPNLTTLSGYQTVIWLSADSFDSAGPEPGIPGTGEDALEDYLDGGGCLFLTAKDYAWDKDKAPATGGPYTALTSLMSGYLGVRSQC